MKTKSNTPVAPKGESRMPPLFDVLWLAIIACLAWLNHLTAPGDLGAAAVNAVLFVAANAFAAWGDLRRDAWRFWTPTFALRVYGLTFFGLGNLVAYWGDAETIFLMQSFYGYSPEETTKTQAVLYVGHFVAVGMGTLAEREMARRRSFNFPTRASTEPTGVNGSIWFLLILGFVVNISLFLEAVAGTGSTVLPGVFNTLATGLMAVLFVGAYQALARKQRTAFLVITLLATVLATASLVRFSKTNVLLPIVMILAAWVTIRPSPLRIGVSASVLLTIFLAINEPTAIARNLLYAEFGRDSGVSIEQRANIWTRALDTNNTQIRSADDANTAFARISYVNATTFAVSRFDQGRPGDTMDDAWEVFIPRILWSDKPIRRRDGEFNFEVQGTADSLSNPGLSAEAYWNFGWSGLVGINLFFGLIVGLWSNFTRGVFEKQQWIYAPIVFMGLFYGQATIQLFVPAVLGPLPIVAGLFVVLRIFLVVLKSNAESGRPFVRNRRSQW